MRCIPCPVATGLTCPGEVARRLCALIDPAHPDHRPGYVAALRGHARQMAEAPAPARRPSTTVSPPSPRRAAHDPLECSS
jgi:hypothetical protein